MIDATAAEQNDKIGFLRDKQKFPEVCACRAAVEDRQLDLADLLPKIARLIRVPRLEYKSIMNQGDYLIEVDALRTDIPKVGELTGSAKIFQHCGNLSESMQIFSCMRHTTRFQSLSWAGVGCYQLHKNKPLFFAQEQVCSGAAVMMLWDTGSCLVNHVHAQTSRYPCRDGKRCPRPRS